MLLPFPSSHDTSYLVEKTGLSRNHLCRLAQSGAIHGACRARPRSPWQFIQSANLDDFIRKHSNSGEPHKRQKWEHRKIQRVKTGRASALIYLRWLQGESRDPVKLDALISGFYAARGDGHILRSVAGTLVYIFEKFAERATKQEVVNDPPFPHYLEVLKATVICGARRKVHKTRSRGPKGKGAPGEADLGALLFR